MRKLILYIATSLDGKIARKDHSIDWLPPVPEASADDYGYRELYNSIDTVVMGYKTYEVCLNLGEWFYKDKTSYVFSRDAAKTTIPEATSVNKSPVDFIKELKQQEGKDIWLLGGGELVALMHDAGLIDEYIIAFIPVLLGEGIPLFPNITQQKDLKVTRHKVYPNGLVLLYLE